MINLLIKLCLGVSIRYVVLNKVLGCVVNILMLILNLLLLVVFVENSVIVFVECLI